MQEGNVANNIIAGPWATQSAITEPLGEVGPEEGILRVKANHIGETLILIAPMIFHNLELAGFMVDDETDVKDTTLIIEAIKSYLYKQYDLIHPLQDVAEAVFVENEKSITFAEALSVVLPDIQKLDSGNDEDDNDLDLLEE